MPRKKPFSVKQKKEQLRAKRELHRSEDRDEFGNRNRIKGKKAKGGAVTGAVQSQSGEVSDDEGSSSHASSLADADHATNRLNQQPHKKTDNSYDPNRYRLHFARETKVDLEKRKEEAAKPLAVFKETEVVVSLENVYRPGSALDMPKRPKWNHNMPKKQLEAKEEHYFKDYIEDIMSKFTVEDLSYFELNLETWRQLWRVLEMADIVLLITDIRHPALHFSPALYHYVTTELHKSLVLVLNKCDLVPPALVTAWKHYFLSQFPELQIIFFTSFPRENSTGPDPGKVLHKKRARTAASALGPHHLLDVCQDIVDGRVDLSSWREKVALDTAGLETTVPSEVRDEEVVEAGEHIAYREGILTIGCCGYPNVGKSSLINGLVGKKVVSVSRTPGHTKHFQTIYLTPSVKLCDCPGLVFPSLVNKPMQVLSGIYPIAQLREPYTTVGYLAQHIPIVQLLRLRHPNLEKKELNKEGHNLQWSAYDLCEAWAMKRGFITAKAARPDMYRAANNILRLAMEGRLCLSTHPPSYSSQKDQWESHSETIAMQHELKNLHKTVTPDSDPESDSHSGPNLYEDDEGDDGDEEVEDDELEEEECTRGRLQGKHLTSSNPFALLGDD